MIARNDKDEIRNIADAIRIMDKLRENADGFLSTGWPFDKFPFGLWFRGQRIEGDRQLEPHVFRKILRFDSKEQAVGTTRHDETNLYVHIKLRAANFQQTYRSAFDWLCLMQHYSMPTRLLDWSESILIALYFAVREVPRLDDRTTGKAKAETDAEVIALNARALNQYVKQRPDVDPKKIRPSIASPSSIETIIRAEMANTRSLKNLKLQASVREAAKRGDIKLKNPDWVETFRKPLAVFPSRLNDRMIFQSSVFTLHGGKYYVEEMDSFYEKDIIPKPIGLEEINQQVYILQRYKIPKDYRVEIRENLFRLGIHEGTLFPEIDRQAIYLRQLW
jgi:FRG domain